MILRSTIRVTVLAAPLFAAAAPLPAGTVTEPVTYQGQLKRGTAPVAGTCDFLFELWNAPSAGDQMGETMELIGVEVRHGLFQVELPLSPTMFDGGGRWLAIAVKCQEDGTIDSEYTALTPRERVTWTPYALQTRGIFVDAAKNIGIGTSQPLYDLHVQTTGTLLGGTSVATAAVHNRFLAGLDFVDRWFDVAVGSDINLSLHRTADLHLTRRFAQDAPSGDTQVFLGADGKVGIGTDAPQAMLHVSVPTAADDAFLKLSTPDDGGIFDAGVLLCNGETFETCAGMVRTGTSLSLRHDIGTVRLGAFGQDVVTVSADLVRIGTGRANADLDVRGNVSVSGNIGMRYTSIDSGWIAGTTQVTVVCPAGTKVIGGGCETEGNADFVKRTYPGSDAGWICVFEIAGSNHRAHAICAGVE